jgi:hypothetical protein
MVESLPSKQYVAGSSPVSCSKYCGGIMAKMNWEKLNRKRTERLQDLRSAEQRKKLKKKKFNPDDLYYTKKKKKTKKTNKKNNTKQPATKKQLDLIRKYKMTTPELIELLSKKGATKVISNYAEKHGWE